MQEILFLEEFFVNQFFIRRYRVRKGLLEHACLGQKRDTLMLHSIVDRIGRNINIRSNLMQLFALLAALSMLKL